MGNSLEEGRRNGWKAGLKAIMLVKARDDGGLN